MLTLSEHGCTRGFTNLERMSAVLGNYGKDDFIEQFKDQSVQVVVPGTRFTCSGRVLTWVFGADWSGGLELFTEIQIWRPTGGEEISYTKIGSTRITTAPNESRLYRYSLSSPLVFQAGDILGFHHGRDGLTQLRLLYQSTDSGPQAYYTEQHTPQTLITIENGTLASTGYHALIGVETGK